MRSITARARAVSVIRRLAGTRSLIRSHPFGAETRSGSLRSRPDSQRSERSSPLRFSPFSCLPGLKSGSPPAAATERPAHWAALQIVRTIAHRVKGGARTTAATSRRALRSLVAWLVRRCRARFPDAPIGSPVRTVVDRSPRRSDRPTRPGAVDVASQLGDRLPAAVVTGRHGNGRQSSRELTERSRESAGRTTTQAPELEPSAHPHAVDARLLGGRREGIGNVVAGGLGVATQFCSVLGVPGSSGPSRRVCRWDDAVIP